MSASARCAGHFCMLGLCSFTAPVGVGKSPDDPHSVASVRRTDVPSAQHTPSDIIPQAGKPFDDDVHASGAQIRTVLGEDIRRPYLANDSEHFEPESAAAACKSRTLTGTANVLAGEASADDIDNASPRPPVEGSDVIPDRERIQALIQLPLSQYAPAVLVHFDGADCSPSEQP